MFFDDLIRYISVHICSKPLSNSFYNFSDFFLKFRIDNDDVKTILKNRIIESLKHKHYHLAYVFNKTGLVICENENQLNDINNSTHSLSEIIAPSEFKTYEELKEKLDRILGLTGGVSNSTAESVAEDQEEVPWANVNTESVADEPVIQSAEASVGESEDDAMDYFKKLAADS